MRQIIVWKIPVIIILGMWLSSNASADYSKTFDGYRIFQANCSVCHGADGSGNGPLAGKLGATPANLTNNDRLNQKSDRELFRIIEGTAPHGTVSKDMPKWGLAIPGTQIKSLVTYIRYLHQSKYPVSGNPIMGKQVYLSNCTICHGYDGRGRGAITKVYDMKPADHTNARSMERLSNEKIHNIISDGGAGASLMPGWKDMLSDKEIDDVVSYIRLLSSK